MKRVAFAIMLEAYFKLDCQQHGYTLSRKGWLKSFDL